MISEKTFDEMSSEISVSSESEKNEEGTTAKNVSIRENALDDTDDGVN